MLKPIKSPPTVIILAAGRGERFIASGGSTHKLAAVFNGKTVLQHTLDAVIATGLPYHVVTAADNVTLGMGDSIARGVTATSGANGWLILPADLPMIAPASIVAVADSLMSSQVAIVQAFVGSQAAHPVGFSQLCRERLLTLQGDAGARSVVQHFKAQGQWQDVALNDTGALTDIDTQQDLLNLSMV